MVMAVNHRVPDGNYSPTPGDFRRSPMGRRTVLFTNSSPPSQLCTAIQSSMITVKHQHTAPQ
ncbi:unnamed protein product [Staurois parvus]|uniref:Uncharacterized protein n=1 Tax=Staurois parvus TaxID=386267 RepID=A0ABN9DPM5_9NEOB|nr:unnamed protein product [Staurois parvus]